MVYVGTYDCYENIKIKLSFTISLLNHDTAEIFNYKKKMIEKFCKLLDPCYFFIYWGISNTLLFWLKRLVLYHLCSGCISEIPAGANIR